MRGLSPVAASGGHSPSRCTGLPLSRPLPLQSTGSRHAGSVAVTHGPSRSAACGIFPDRGTNPCPLHWQVDSQPLRHQGSPWLSILYTVVYMCQSQSPNSSHPPSPLGNHKFVLYICDCFCFANKLVSIIFLDSTYKRYYTIFDFLSDLLLSV